MGQAELGRKRGAEEETEEEVAQMKDMVHRLNKSRNKQKMTRDSQ
jgi:hypothetical protein